MTKALPEQEAASENKILNAGLTLAMEFGEHWLMPIQERLSAEFSFLEKSALDHYDKVCRSAMEAGQKFVMDLLGKISKEKSTISSKQLLVEFSVFVAEHYPWMNKSNIEKLMSQACYYAYKDGFTGFAD